MFRLSVLIIIALWLTACSAPTTISPTGEAVPSDVPGGEAISPGGQSARSAAPGVLEGAVIVDDSFVTIYGEFLNPGQRWLHNIQIIVTYFDAEGNEIYEDKVPTEILFTGPGERVPFYVVTDKSRMTGTYASHAIGVTSIENDQAGYLLAVDFTDPGVSYGVGEVSGTVRHNGPGTCGYPTVAVAYYDAAGKVLAVSSNYLETLSSGQETSFKLLTPMTEPEYSQVAVWAACREINGTPVP
jgi:hypothetical protein